MKEQLIESAASALLALVALGVAAWALLSGQVRAQGVDGLFLIVICLLLAAAFSFVPFLAIREGLLRNILAVRKGAVPAANREEAAADKEFAQGSSKPA